MANLMLVRQNGSTVIVDTSHSACGEFGWHHGDRFVDHKGNVGEVMGVGPCMGLSGVPDGSFKVLWVILDKDRNAFSRISGNAIYYVNKAKTADASRVCLQGLNPKNTGGAFDELLRAFNKVQQS